MRQLSSARVMYDVHNNACRIQIQITIPCEQEAPPEALKSAEELAVEFVRQANERMDMSAAVETK
jgi:hypothetical protein